MKKKYTECSRWVLKKKQYVLRTSVLIRNVWIVIRSVLIVIKDYKQSASKIHVTRGWYMSTWVKKYDKLNFL